MWDGCSGDTGSCGGSIYYFNLSYLYNVTISTYNITDAQMITIYNAVEDMANSMGGNENFKLKLGGVDISLRDIEELGLGGAHQITLNTDGFSKWTVAHELAHAWDAANDWNLSRDMKESLGAGFDHPIKHFVFPKNSNYWYNPGQGPPPCGIDGNFNAKEDFAESVTAYSYPIEAESKANDNDYPYNNPNGEYYYLSFFDTPRGQYIKTLLMSIP